MKHVTVAAVVIGLIICGHVYADDLSIIDRSHWSLMKPYEKTSYINGFMDGIHTQGRYPDFAGLDFFGLTVAQASKALNQFYQDYKNQTISVPVALLILHMEMRGDSMDHIEKFKETMRRINAGNTRQKEIATQNNKGRQITLIKVNYIDCYDGDTCHFLFNGEKDKFRFWDIDAPEIAGHCQDEINLAIKSRDYLKERLSEATEITIEHKGMDKYHRRLANVYADGEKLNDELIEKGFAVKWKGKRDPSVWCSGYPKG